jgi:nicotinamide-nucleotide amidase
VTPAVGLVLVGAELVEGRTRDGNGAWLARRVTEEGARLAPWTVVPDDEDAIAAAIRAAAATAQLVLVSGGLGPTEDDRTRAGLARAAGVGLVEDPGAWAFVLAVLERRGRSVLPAQRRQALVPEGGRWLANPVGIAPALAVRVGACDVVALPGVPQELEALYESEVLPRVRALPGREATGLEMVLTVGLPETEVARRLGALATSKEPSLGWYPHQGEVEVSVRTHGPDALERARATAQEVRRLVGDAALDAPAGTRTQHAVLGLLRSRGVTLATAESLTGGLVAQMLTQVPGASDVLRAGFVAYHDDAKRRDLGVPAELLERHGALSAEVAVAMAEGARRRAGTDAALATTGVAGPADVRGPAGRVPAGTFFVAAALEGAPTRVVRHDVPLERTVVQRRAALAALDLLRRLLLGLPDGPR